MKGNNNCRCLFEKSIGVMLKRDNVYLKKLLMKQKHLLQGTSLDNYIAEEYYEYRQHPREKSQFSTVTVFDLETYITDRAVAHCVGFHSFSNIMEN